MAKLESLTVRGFKSIRSLEDFKPGRLNVLIGANGAGKSNFIGLFHMLACVIEKRLQVFVAEHDGPDALLFGGRKRTGRIEIMFSFGGDAKAGLTGRNAYSFSLVPTGNRLIFDQEEREFDNIAGFSLGSGHDELKLEILDEKVEDSFAHYIRPAISEWRVYHFHDTSTTAPIRQLQAVRDNLLFKSGGDNLGPYLRQLREKYPDHYHKIVETVQLAAPFFGGFVYRKDIGENMELEWFQADDPDTVQGPGQLSDGTLRFICLTTLLLQPAELQPELILIDEPELGLHPFALTLLAEILRQASDTRQIIVSTQSADLVSELAPEDVVVVNRKDGASTFERLDEDNLTDWLEDYSLGELWKMNIFCGRPAG